MTTTNSPSESVAREILSELLADRPRFGAQLRPLLERALRSRGIRPEVAMGRFRKFSDFLTANADLVEVTSPNGPGDIEVRLRLSTLNEMRETPSAFPAPEVRAERINRDVWQAFTNPDPRRKRFLNRRTGEIVHFVEGSSHPRTSDYARRVAADPDFVEVEFINAEQHTTWMREFLVSTTTIPDWTRRTAEHLLTVPYESSLNTAFVSALGDSIGSAWNRWRALKVVESVKVWATRHSVPLHFVILGQAVPEVVTAQTSAVTNDDGISDIRTLLHRVIDVATEEELKQITISPAPFARLLGVRE